MFAFYEEFQKLGHALSPYLYPDNEPQLIKNSNNSQTFRNLPGFIADALPDNYGNKVVESFYKTTYGIPREEVGVLRRLLYAGRTAFGSLDFRPEVQDENRYQSLVGNFEKLKKEAKEMKTSSGIDQNEDPLETLYRLGGSAGGLRAKAIALYCEEREELDTDLTPRRGYQPVIIKFAGVEEGMPPNQYTLVEYVYLNIASLMGIKAPKTWLYRDSEGLEHLLIRRFDRNEKGEKPFHYVSLCGLMEKDFRDWNICSYEDYFWVTDFLTNDYSQIEQAFRRAIFNIVFRNQDDHTKNFGFLMTKEGQWYLSPAFDLTYAYDSSQCNVHQMSFNGKNDDFTYEDLLDVGIAIGLKKKKIIGIIEDAMEASEKFIPLAVSVGLPEDYVEGVHRKFRIFPS